MSQRFDKEFHVEIVFYVTVLQKNFCFDITKIVVYVKYVVYRLLILLVREVSRVQLVRMLIELCSLCGLVRWMLRL